MDKWILKAGLLVLIIVSLDLCNAEESPDGKDVQKPFNGPFRPVVMRRRIVRKRIIDGESTNTTNVSVSMSVSKVQGDKAEEPLLPRDALNAEGPRRPFGKFRPTFMNRNRSFGYTPTMEPRETPSVSFREFRLTMRPRIQFTRKPVTSPSTTEAEADEEEETSKLTTTLRPFQAKRIIKGKPRRRTTTTTEEPEDDDHDEDADATAEEDDATNEVDGPEEVSSTTNAQPTTTILTTTTPSPTTTTTEETSIEDVPPPKRNSSMIIIPVPPSQRKPYHPVIMQVTKTPTTPESLAETKVVTYKLNKMFVPMGIYGKVLPKSATKADLDVTTENSIVSTPLPFLLPGQEGKRAKGDEAKKHKGYYSSTPSPEIQVKVKGHRSKEVEYSEPMTSGDDSMDFSSAVAYATSQKDHHERQQKQWESMMEKLKKKQRNLADSVDLTYPQRRRPNIQDISLTTERIDASKISLTTEQAPNFERTDPGKWTAAGYKGGMQDMPIPRPYPRPPQPTKSIMGTLASAASSIPGLIHESFTSVLSGYGNAFDDEARFPGSTESSKMVGAESQSQGVTPAPEDESLEYFRKRPHLLNKKNRGKSNFLPPEYSSGFKPVTAPPHFASQYYASASTPKYRPTPRPLPTSTMSFLKAAQREPLFSGSKYWPTEAAAPSSIRSAKQFLTMNDLAAWKEAIMRGQGQEDNQPEQSKGFSFGSTTPGYSRPRIVSSTPKSFADQWYEFNKKYSQYEIDEAKDKIYNMFSESRSDPYDSLMFMKPPSALAKSPPTSAFDDLLKMFKMGFSFGAGHSASEKPMLKYAAGMHASDDTFTAASGDGWKPLTKPGGSSMISFNAGVTIGGKPTSTPAYMGYGGGSHFSSSTKPFVPKSKYKEHYNPKDFSQIISGTKALTSQYKDQLRPSPTPDYLSNVYYSPVKFNEDSDSGSETNKNPRFEINPAISTHYSPSGPKPTGFVGFERNKLDFSKFGSMKYLNDQAIEIIPSSEFFKQKGNMADIAAVIKPPELSDELVKAALPPQISAVPQLSYPTQQLIQNPQGYTSLSQLQQYFATAQPSPTPHPTPSYAILPQQQFHNQFGQPQLFFHPQGNFIQQGHPQQFMQIHPSQQPPPRPLPPQQQSSQSIKATGDSGLGFSEFELPAGVDPDIASLLRAELSKDDIPEEYRKDFIEAQEQEKKKQQGQQASASRLRVTVIKPGQKQPARPQQQQKQQPASKRSDTVSKPEIKFHKPIPINPTMLTPTKGKPIRASPVPRYVVELARKLKTDKDVQGIVRVSTKRNRGPPIEYLYPVRG